MINLIPPEGHRVAKREYLLRVGATFGFLFGVTLLLITIAHIPMYVLVDAQIQNIDASVAQYKDNRETTREIDEEVERTKAVLGQLSSVVDAVSVTTLLSEVRRVAPDNITLKSFMIKTDDAGDMSIYVQGIAPTREALATFKVALEGTEMFEEAHIPISDLARDTNLPFAITIALRTDT